MVNCSSTQLLSNCWSNICSNNSVTHTSPLSAVHPKTSQQNAATARLHQHRASSASRLTICRPIGRREAAVLSSSSRQKANYTCFHNATHEAVNRRWTVMSHHSLPVSSLWSRSRGDGQGTTFLRLPAVISCPPYDVIVSPFPSTQATERRQARVSQGLARHLTGTVSDDRHRFVICHQCSSEAGWRTQDGGHALESAFIQILSISLWQCVTANNDQTTDY